jgi:hypothetical protein
MSMCAARCKTSKIAGACRVVPPRAAKVFRYFVAMEPFSIDEREFSVAFRLRLAYTFGQ